MSPEAAGANEGPPATGAAMSPDVAGADEGPPAKAPRTERPGGAAAPEARKVCRVGFLGISDYGMGQLRVLAARYEVAFATAKWKRPGHAEGLSEQLAAFCRAQGIEYLGAVDANSPEMVKRAQETDLVIIGGYDRILKRPILEAPKYGVLNTHLGVLPLNRGCCPTMWAQLHGLPQGYTTYHVGTAVDHGAILDRFEAGPELGGLKDTNRDVYDCLAQEAMGRFAAALERFESGAELLPCEGREAYHRQGLPNESCLSFHWSNEFLRRFSLALDFRPYLPGRTRILAADKDMASDGAAIFLAILAADGIFQDRFACSEPAALSAELARWRDCEVGEVLAAKEEEGGGPPTVLVRTREGALWCRVCRGPAPAVGERLESLGGQGVHPIDLEFAGAVLPLERYLCGAARAG